MKVNLHMIREDLADLNLRGHLSDEPWVMRCTHAAACTHLVRELREDVIYILKPGLLPRHVPSGCGSPSIISIGKPADEWVMSSCNLLYVDEGVELLDLFNRVSEAIAGYQEWEDDLVEALDGQPWEDAFVECASRYFHNPFLLGATEFQSILSYSPDDADSAPLMESYMEDYGSYTDAILSPEDVNTFISDEEYYRASDAIEPYMYSGKYFKYRSLVYNIREGGERLGILTMDEVVEPITGRDFALIKVAGQHLRKVLSQNRGGVISKPKEIDPILQGLLSHRLLPENHILLLLAGLGWDMDDDYACLVLRLRAVDGNEAALETLALGVSRTLSLECYTVFDGSLVFVCNLTKMGIGEGEILSGQLPFLRDNLLMASQSSTYCDFKELYYYYLQAMAAFEIGLDKDPMRWVFRFEDYEMDYLLGKATQGSIPGVLVPEGLKRLRREDETKGGNYMEMLRVYLDNDRGVSDSIRILKMNRSTFLYRIHKAEEIMGLDLDDPDTRLILQIALRAMDMEEGRDR